MISRRDFLKVTAAGGAASILSSYGMAGVASAQPPFSVPLRVPPILTPKRTVDGIDHYEIFMRRNDVRILEGKRTRIWGFNGRFPGPTIKVTKGKPVVVRQVNRLKVPTTIHLHGGNVSPRNDGHPLDLIEPGGRKDYHYPNEQNAATLWYHDHTHHVTSRNVYMGLAGLYIIEDPDERDLNLPRGKFDIPLVIQDRTFTKDNALLFRDRHDNVVGDTYLVNGCPVPFLKVANRKYRFRILNASNSRNYTIALDTGQPLIQIASDGGLLAGPVTANSIPLWPAERVEVVVDFSSYPVGTSVTLQDLFGLNPMDAKPIMRFDVDREEDDPSQLPTTLGSIDELGAADNERFFKLQSDANRGLWLINGKTFARRRIDARPKLGTIETWTFDNVSNLAHPMHLHLVMFKVLDRNGVPASGGESGWKDTVAVASNETVRVAMRFADHAGKYVFHCHNLAHGDHGMMAQMRVTK